MRHIRRLFDHMYWADDRLMALLEALRIAPDAEEEVAHLFAHLVAAEQIWLLRVTGGDPSGVPVWPERSVSDTVEVAREVRAGFEHLLEGVTEAELEATIEYRNTKGTGFRNALEDILLHVALHGAYHRGQIARAVRQAGGEPVNTDLITFVRE